MRRDGGFTLVELLLALVILGLASAGILGGIATSVRASGITRDLATAEGFVRSAAESVHRANFNGCANTYAMPATPAGFSAPTITVTPASVTGTSPRVLTTTGVPCANAWLQQVSIVIRSQDTTVERSVTLIKRRPS